MLTRVVDDVGKFESWYELYIYPADSLVKAACAAVKPAVCELGCVQSLSQETRYL